MPDFPLESHLGVAKPQVGECVARVWKSGFGARLARYRAGVSGGGAPAVIVQRMVEGEAAQRHFGVSHLDPQTLVP